MLTSATGRSASPLLAALLVTLSGVAAPAATVIATEHYQQRVVLTCPGTGTGCSGLFPRPGTNRRLTITRMNCFMVGPSGTAVYEAGIVLASANFAHLLTLYLPANQSTTSGGGTSHTINQPVDLQIAARQRTEVYINLAGGTPTHGNCTATGRLDTLQ